MTSRAQVSSGAICYNSFVLPVALGNGARNIIYADGNSCAADVSHPLSMDHYVSRDATT